MKRQQKMMTKMASKKRYMPHRSQISLVMRLDTLAIDVTSRSIISICFPHPKTSVMSSCDQRCRLLSIRTDSSPLETSCRPSHEQKKKRREEWFVKLTYWMTREQNVQETNNAGGGGGVARQQMCDMQAPEERKKDKTVSELTFGLSLAFQLRLVLHPDKRYI